MAYPLFCLVASGRKHIYFKGEIYDLHAGSFLVVGTNMPMVAEIVEAPCPALSLALDLNELVMMAADLPPKPEEESVSLVSIEPLGSDVRDAVVRLLRLLDQPKRIGVLSPLVQREILYLLLQQSSSALRALASPKSRLSQISKVVSRIRGRYAQTLPIEELADIAEMSVPSLHRHFRAITGSSPL